MVTNAEKAPRRAILFGHADGDGYLAAEVSRENLVSQGWTVSDVIADPLKTPNYRFWQGHFREWDFSYTDLVVTVDIAFDRKNPSISCQALADHANKFPDTRFLVIDHHELIAGDWLPSNVTLIESGSVYDCCYGDPNDLMVIASICDKDEEPVKARITEGHRILAEGINRAARDKGGAAGDALMNMLAKKQWAAFIDLGLEPKDSHRSMYGSRISNSDPSPTLDEIIAGEK